MDPQWEKVKDIVHAALEKTSGSERERFLQEACAGDTDLSEEVRDLLESVKETDDFLEESPIGEFAETIVGGKNESLSAGQQIGRYRIERHLGAGGAGEVFLARDIELRRLVALKILSAEFSLNPGHVRRFVQEARAASALNHPNILTIYESGQLKDVHFIAAEYIEGETLRTRLRRAPMNLNEILEIIAQTAVALNAAHRAGIVHRDIKPENIMLRADGLVKVLDFGLAKLVEKDSAESQNLTKTEFKTTPGLVMGTVAYMSPEQARGLPTDQRTDVWSIGVCLSEIVFGIHPFTGETVSDQIAAILKSEPEPQDSDAPPALRSIIHKCLEKNIENRYQTMDDLLLDVNNLRRESDYSTGREHYIGRILEPTGIRETVRQKSKKTGAGVANGSSMPTASSAEYVVGELKKHKGLSLVGAFLTVVVFGLILYFSAFNSFFSAKPIHSVAVLPFTNESGDTDNEFLSDGLSESLINKLSNLPQLKVAARSSAFKYKNKTADTREIARTLNVEAIVNGRVIRRGDDLQISVELINAAEGTQIWGETYRQKVADAQAIQDEIAQTIVQKLQITPTGAATKSFNAPITKNAQAYQFYLNGVFHRRKNGPENVKKAIEYQNQAIALDPNFALAYAELGTNFFNMVAAGVSDSKTGIPPARAAIEKALSLDETLAQAHDINSSLKAAEFDWNGAETEIRRAIELNPNLASAHAYYAELLSELGRFDESLSEIRLARQMDPLRVNLVNNEAAILICARRYDEAFATYESGALEAVGEVFALIDRARLETEKKRYAEAIALLEKSLKPDRTTRGLIYLARAYALNGERRKALAILEELKKSDQLVSPVELSILYAALGMSDLAFECLERAFAERDLLLPVINIQPEYDTLRDDLRFSDLLRRLNLPSKNIFQK